MATRQTRGTAQVPDLLTVEEAAAVLRIGRTKAYAMAREWRASGGRSGLPVIDFGNALRVPRHALEQLVGAPVTEIPQLNTADDDEEQSASPFPPVDTSDAAPEPRPTRRPATRARSRRAPTRPTNQLDLFELPPSA